jgi:FHS family Na+ dependent glucose MFS transporter 1
MAAVLAVIVALLLLVPFAAWLTLLILLMFVLGVNEGALDVGCNTLIVWVHGHRVGPYMQALHFFFGVGAFLSPIVVAQALVWSGGVDWAYRALALLLVPAALWLWRTPSPAAQRVSDQGAGQVNRALVALVMLFLFIYAGVEGGFGGWVFAYVTGLGLSDGPTAAYLTSTFWGALTLGRLLAIPLAARFSPGALLFGDLLAALLSIGVVLAGPGSLALTWLGTVAFGLAIASIFPTTLALAERRMTITGQVTGWFFVGSSLGAMFWPWLIGQLFDASGPSPTMLIVAFDLAAALLLFFLMNAYARRSALKPVETAEA